MRVHSSRFSNVIETSNLRRGIPSSKEGRHTAMPRSLINSHIPRMGIHKVPYV